MREELKEDYYDEAYIGNTKYKVHYKESPYYNIWKYVVSLIQKDAKVLDLGCGTGQVAQLLIDSDIDFSYGVDFSKTAIDMANKIVAANFYKADLYHVSTYNKHQYNTVICLEVLEHIENDLIVLDHINKGTTIILTVPNYDSLGHVRYFKNMEEIKTRFGKSFNIIHEKTFDVGDQDKKIFLIYGTK